MQDSLFDSSERQVLSNAEFFVTKAAIDAKINALFDELKAEIEEESKSVLNLLPPGFPLTGGRIHRGEHYGPFPWRAVDCPAGFQKDGFLAFRCLLLWGHHFSFHLLLSGKWLSLCLDRLCLAAPQLAESGLQLSLQDNPWKWEFNLDTHLPLAQCPPERLRRQAREKSLVKLSLLHPLEYADSLVSTGRDTWHLLQNSLFLSS